VTYKNLLDPVLYKSTNWSIKFVQKKRIYILDQHQQCWSRIYLYTLWGLLRTFAQT